MKVSDFHENYGKGYRLFFAAMRYHEYVGWEKPFKRSEAWMWLIFEACGKEKGREVVRDFGGKVRVIREEWGQVTHSERFIADAFGWSRQRVSTFLQHLSNTNPPMIVQNVSQQISQITICNFKDYQKPKATKQASSKPAVSQQQASSKPNYNTLIRNNDKTNIPDFFNTPKFLTTLQDFKQMRNKIKKPLTDRGEVLLIAKLARFSNQDSGTAIEIMENSILGCWQGVFELKSNGKVSTESTHERCVRKGLIKKDK